MINRDEFYMRRCLQLARCGAGYVSPNPMVGAVVVCDGRIIGEGYHRRCGEAHAEVNAIGAVKDAGLLSRSTLYVSLEPCSHYGKTPPCAELIINKKIPRVVVGCLDPFEKVSGRGIAMLRSAGVVVITGILEKECWQLNRFFMYAQTHKEPYVILKWAQSQNGYIDRKRSSKEAAEVFSTPVTSAFVHKLRSEVDAICVGSGTVCMDNPSLSVRLWSGKNPLRIVFDRRNKLPKTLNVFIDGLPIRVLTQAEVPDSENVKFWKLDSADASIRECLHLLYKQGIHSLLVEGGASLLQSFIDCGCWNETRVEVSPKKLTSGVASPQLTGVPANVQQCDGADIYYYRNNE